MKLIALAATAACVALASPSLTGPVGDTTLARTVRVEVQPTKPGGKPWDAFGGAPDLALCVRTELGQRCYPDGHSPSQILRPVCRDALSCSFEVTVPRQGSCRLVVVDVDVMVNDVVGEAPCSEGTHRTQAARLVVR